MGIIYSGADWGEGWDKLGTTASIIKHRPDCQQIVEEGDTIIAISCSCLPIKIEEYESREQTA